MAKRGEPGAIDTLNPHSYCKRLARGDVADVHPGYGK